MMISKPRDINSREYPSSKGHALRSAAATLFDGKPSLKFLQNGSWDQAAGGVANIDTSLITETKIVPVDPYNNVFQPRFDKVDDESMRLESGTGARMIARDKEYFE